MNLIVTPEYVQKVLSLDADIQIFAYRYDRGLSEQDAHSVLPGEKANLERGLNDNKYIVPGAGGLGELMNNSEK